MNLLKPLFFVLLLSGSLIAQRADKSIYVNLKGGINISGLVDELNGVESSGKAGYNFGLDLRLGDGLIFFQPGAFYYQYLMEYKVVESSLMPNGETSYKTDVKVTSVKVPVQMGIRLFTTDVIALRANLGPAVNFPVTIDSDKDFVIDRDHYKVVTVGGVVGAGVDLAFFTFDLNYEFGLSDYIEFKDPKIESSSSSQYVLTFNVGIRF